LKKKILFICSYNVSRSRTAEDLFVNSEKYEARSAGLEYHQEGKKIVDQESINWADIIVAMNETVGSHEHPPCRHLSRLKAKGFDLRNKEIAIFDIPDIYGRGDLQLIKILKSKLVGVLGIIV
jgi:predicted protein tyrosine phosphatase